MLRRVIEPVAAWDSRDIVLQTIIWQVMGVLLMVCHVVLVRLSLAFYPLTIILITMLFARASMHGLLILFQVTLYQNMIISLFTTDMSYTAFNMLQGTNFVLLAAMALVSALRLMPMIEYRRIATSMIVAMVALLIYTGIGALKSGPMSALIYFREFSGPLLAGIVGMEVGRLWSYQTVGRCFLYGASISVSIAVFEYFYPIDYYQMVGAVRFMQLKFHSQPVLDVFFNPKDIVLQSTSVFFNITGASDSEYAMKSYRVWGTILNPISGAYIMSVLALIALSLKRYLWLFVLLPMLLLVGVKGAAILLLSSALLYMVWSATKSRIALLSVGILFTVAYVGLGVHFGARNNDFHVLGFLGGVNSFIHNPVGHGIGVGGNLSERAAKGFHWTGAGGLVSAGADFALESAIGVLIYQMGVAAIAVLAVFWMFIREVPLGWARYSPRRTDLMIFALPMVVVNGIFQEEAFAPYSAGLIMILVGVLIGNWRRPAQLLEVRSPSYLGALRPA